jgi:S1-C subfamily serine protease
LQNARGLVSFLVKAVIVGLALAFLVVWWRPMLLAARTATAAVPPAPAALGPARPVVVMQSFADSVARAAPAVVNIYTRRVVTEQMQATPLSQLFGDYWPSYRRRIENSLGSGVIVDAKGTIVTNQHVIAGAESIQVQLVDGRIYDSAIVG